MHGDKVTKIFGSPRDFNLKFVACVDKNFGLGYKNNLLFKIPADLKNFRNLTLGNTIILGRKTLQTFPNAKPLEGRKNLILSRTIEKFIPSVEELFCKLNPAEKNFVVGGAEIFSELLPYAQEIFLSVVNSEKNADKFFPKFEDNFNLVEIKNFPEFELRRYLPLT